MMEEELSQFSNVYKVSSASKDNKDSGRIKFDIAITASKLNGKDASIGVLIGAIGGKGKESNSTQNENLTRIQFHVEADADIS